MHRHRFFQLSLLTLAVTGASSTLLAAPAPQFTQQQDTIRVDGFDLLHFKAAPELGWTEEKVRTFLEGQLKKFNNRFSMRDLEILARQLSIQMKQAGLMFSRAAVLDQEIKNNRVEIVFEDGLLGEVVIMNAERTKPKLLVRPFLPYLQHTAVRRELDQALYQLDKLPGIDVFGFFSFSSTPGLSRLNLKVVDETGWTARFSTDNYGSEALGRERINGQLEILNPTGWGDDLKLSVGRGYTDPGFLEGYAQYTIPIGAQYQPLRFLVSNSDFDLGQGFESLEIFGRSTLASMDYRHQLSIGQGSIVLDAGISASKSKVDSVFYSDLFLRETNVQTFKAGAQYSNLIMPRLSHTLRAGVRVGSYEESSNDEDLGEVLLEDSFVSLDSFYQMNYYHNDSKRIRHTTFNLELFGSNDPLPSVEQRSFGGKNGVRGLPTGYFSADHGAMAHLSYDTGIWPASFPGTLTFFTDAGFGRRVETNNLIQNSAEQTAQFASVGLGYTWKKGRFQLNYDFGKILHANLDDESATQAELDDFSENKPSRHYLSMSYQLGEYK